MMHKWLLISNGEAEAGDSALFEKWKQQPGSLLWVDIEGTAVDANHKLLIDMLALPEAEVRDGLRERHPPAFVGDRDFLFLLLKPLDSESHDLDFNTQQMAIFSGTGFVVTRHNKTSDYLHRLLSKVGNGERQITSPYEIVALLTH